MPYCYWHKGVKNGNFTLLLTSSGQEWKFHIATDIKWSRMAISHCYSHLVVKNSNFTLLLTSSDQEWQFHIATDIKWSRMAISPLLLTSSGQEWQLADLPLDFAGRSSSQINHGIYIVGFIWQPFWILQEKLGISFFFWIIRFVNSQLALYSHVRCNPPSTPPRYLSDEVTNIRCEMKYPDKLSDIPPENLSDEVTNIRCEMMYPDQLSDIPLPQNLSDEVTNTRCEMMYPDKLSDISPWCWHPVVKTGSFTLLMTSSGLEW